MILEILLAWILADFMSGIGHWIQDILLDRETRFSLINTIKKDNDLHHSVPTATLQLTYWENINTTAPLMWAISVGLIILSAPTLWVLAFFFLGFANLIHRFAHEPRSRTNVVIKLLQKLGVFISFEQHQDHHIDAHGLIRKENSSRCYCVMGSWLNPIMDQIGFFKILTKIARACVK